MKRNILIMNQAQCLTSFIVHLADSANFKGVTSNKLCNGLTGSCFESPNDTIHVTVSCSCELLSNCIFEVLTTHNAMRYLWIKSCENIKGGTNKIVSPFCNVYALLSFPARLLQFKSCTYKKGSARTKCCECISVRIIEDIVYTKQNA